MDKLFDRSLLECIQYAVDMLDITQSKGLSGRQKFRERSVGSLGFRKP